LFQFFRGHRQAPHFASHPNGNTFQGAAFLARSAKSLFHALVVQHVQAEPRPLQRRFRPVEIVGADQDPHPRPVTADPRSDLCRGHAQQPVETDLSQHAGTG